MPGELSTLDLAALALMIIGVGVLLVVCVPTGGAKPGMEEWRRGAVKHHAWQPRHADQPSQVDTTPPGLSIEDSLSLLVLAAQIQRWPAQDRWPDTDLVRRYIPGRHTAHRNATTTTTLEPAQ